MKESILFGNKSIFAIEILPGEISELGGSLRLWIDNKSIGSFKRKGEYIHGIRNLKKYFNSKESLYESRFDNLDEKSCLAFYHEQFDLVNSLDKNDWNEFERRKKYIRWFGDHMDPISMSSLYKDGIVTWIIYNGRDQKNPVKFFIINAKEIEDAFTEFITWYENKFGVVFFNPNVFP